MGIYEAGFEAPSPIQEESSELPAHLLLLPALTYVWQFP